MGRALTQTLHGVRAENLAGPLGPEVVASNIFTVASTEHQLIPVFLLLRFQSLLSDSPSSMQPLCAIPWAQELLGVRGTMPCWASPGLYHSQDQGRDPGSLDQGGHGLLSPPLTWGRGPMFLPTALLGARVTDTVWPKSLHGYTIHKASTVSSLCGQRILIVSPWEGSFSQTAEMGLFSSV